MPDSHWRTLRIASRMTNVFEDDIPGLIAYRALLTRTAPAGETWVPEVTRSDSGVWRCHNFQSADGTERAQAPSGADPAPF